MYPNLNAGAIGVQATLAEVIDLASRYGFGGVDFSITEAAQLAAKSSVESVQELFREADVRPGLWGFPVDFRKDEATWRQGLDALPAQAELAQALGCFRTATWILPGHDDRNFQENFDFHLQRLRPAAEILADHGHRLGLEFVGPKTLRDTMRHEFIYNLEGMLELCQALGTGNVGLLLDIWHLYTAHDDVADVRTLSNEQIVTVHVNDAPEGVPVDEQLDQVRALPGETGVLDLAGFLQALHDIGYDGPVTAEPFSQRLRSLPAEQAVRETRESLRQIWEAAGLTQ